MRPGWCRRARGSASRRPRASNWPTCASRRAPAFDFPAGFLRVAGAFMNGQDVDKMVRGVALKAGADINKTNAALNAAFVAAGVRDAKDPKAAAKEAGELAGKVLKLHKDEPAEDIGQIAGAAARIKKAAPKGTTDEEVIGTLEAAQQQAGLQGEGALAKHLIPRLLDADTKGVKVNEFSALYAGLAHKLGDQGGKLTDTAIVELLGQTKKHFPDKDPAEVIEKMMAGGAEGNKLTAQHETITSIWMREWAHVGHSPRPLVLPSQHASEGDRDDVRVAREV